MLRLGGDGGWAGMMGGKPGGGRRERAGQRRSAVGAGVCRCVCVCTVQATALVLNTVNDLQCMQRAYMYAGCRPLTTDCLTHKVLVLEPQHIPDAPPDDLNACEHRGQDIGSHELRRQRQRPAEAERHVERHGRVVSPERVEVRRAVLPLGT